MNLPWLKYVDLLDHPIFVLPSRCPLLELQEMNWKTLSDHIYSANPPLQTFTSIQHALLNLNKTHTIWVCQSRLSEEQLFTETYLREWLENKWKQSFILGTKIMLSAFSATPLVLTNKLKLLQYCAKNVNSNLRY